MNKKTLFLILSSIVFLPALAFAVNSPTVIAQKIEDLMTTIGAAIVVIGWIIAGILYLLSMGDPGKTTTARKALIAAIIGTIIVVIAKVGYDGIKAFLNPIIGA